MHSPGLIAFLILLLRFEVFFSSHSADHYGNKLDLLHDSLSHYYDIISQDSDDYDDDRTEKIAEAIIREAERRLKKRELSKKYDFLSSNGQNDKNDTNKKSLEEIHDDLRDIIHDDIKPIKKKYNTAGNDLKRNILSFSHVKNDEVKVSHGDNDQVATLDIENQKPELNDKDNNSIHVVQKAFQQKVISTNKIDRSGLDEFSFIAIIVACCVAGVAGIGLVSFCWYRLKTETKDLYKGSPSFKPNGGNGKKTITDEEKLVQGAEVFHYLHAKKQMQQIEEPTAKYDHCSVNGSSDDEEDDDEDTVYECPGLAPPGDMKVVNPLFSDTESHYSDPPSLQSTPTPPSEEK